jgi:Fe-S-cluster-containing dehydrogenase component
MCHNRSAEGREPACVGACPEGAIQIEIVNIADWKRDYAASANAQAFRPRTTALHDAHYPSEKSASRTRER